MLVGLRVLTLLAVAAMLVEPVLVFTRRETVRSHLALILDDSESMTFSDPYTDDSRAVEIAAALAAPVRGRAVARASGSARRRGWTSSRRPSARTWTRWHAAGSCTSTTSNPRRGRGRGDRSGRGSSTRSSRSGRCLRWAMRSEGVLASHRGQPVAGLVLATDGRSNTGEDPLRAVEAAVRQNIPIYADRRRGRRGAAERPPRRDRGQPRRLRPRPDDAGRRGRGARAPRRRGDDRPGADASTRATGSRSATSGSRSGRTASSSGRRSGSSPRSSASTSSAPASRTPARS